MLVRMMRTRREQRAMPPMMAMSMEGVAVIGGAWKGGCDLPVPACTIVLLCGTPRPMTATSPKMTAAKMTATKLVAAKVHSCGRGSPPHAPDDRRRGPACSGA